MPITHSLSLLLALSSALAAHAADVPPNILFIMADDHAAHAIGAYGSRINETPNIDRIARGGMKFTNCFVTNSICTPSRAAILTGKYAHINGVPVFNRFDGSQPTLAKYLQGAGYHTGYRLIHFQKIDQWEMFDLKDDAHELKNLFHDPEQAALRSTLQQELQRLKRDLRDEDQFAK